MSAVYGFAVHGPDLVPSATGVVNGTIKVLDKSQTINVCRGQTNLAASFYLGNKGDRGSGTYYLRLRLSTTPPIINGNPSGGYTESTNVVATYTHSLGAFSEGTYPLMFDVPGWLPDGTYFIYLDMDPDNVIHELSESIEDDNHTVSAIKLAVSC